jgi:hypothetical protein
LKKTTIFSKGSFKVAGEPKKMQGAQKVKYFDLNHFAPFAKTFQIIT